ncbi:MAG TPA: hypothetical protein VHC69_17315 [Polyangiaceae bacterium]|nr:hypothetical protein [Polyangiaceae bacterium]
MDFDPARRRFFAGAFLAGVFLAEAFLAGVFLAGAFLAEAFLAGAFVVGFLARLTPGRALLRRERLLRGAARFSFNVSR